MSNILAQHLIYWQGQPVCDALFVLFDYGLTSVLFVFVYYSLTSVLFDSRMQFNRNILELGLPLIMNTKQYFGVGTGFN
jgi:hypothetical protein